MKYLVLFLATLSLTSSYAQDKPKKFEFGFGGGVNYSFASISPASGRQVALPGFNAALVFNYRISNRFFVDARTSYAEQSTKYEDDVLGGFASLEVVNRYSWITAPVQLNYILTPKLPSKFFVGLGLSPQRLLSAFAEYKEVWLGGGSGVVTGSSRLGRANDWNLSALGQAGVQISLKQGGKILAMLSFERNLINVLKPLHPNPLFDYAYAPADMRLNSFSLGVTYVY